MKPRIKKILYTTGGTLAAILVVLFLVYGTNSHDPFSLLLKQFAPAKIVGTHMVTVYDLQISLDVSRKLDPTVNRDRVIDQLIRSEKMRSLAGKLNLRLDSDDVWDELNFINKNKEDEYQTVLKDYFGGNETAFLKLVAYPQAWEALLRKHYNSDVSANTESYSLAQTLLTRIENGEKFEDLAKLYSNDQVSGQLGGDLGFFEHGEILPELEEQISIATRGSLIDKVLVSRLGYHIVLPIETAMQGDNKLWHAKHILIETKGFEQWLENQTKNIQVWNIVD